MLMAFVHHVVVAILPHLREKAEAVESRKADQSIYYSAYPRGASAENGSNQVKPEKANQAPIDGANYGKGKSRPI
jgi:hypothetical protein